MSKSRWMSRTIWRSSSNINWSAKIVSENERKKIFFCFLILQKYLYLTFPKCINFWDTYTLSVWKNIPVNHFLYFRDSFFVCFPHSKIYLIEPHKDYVCFPSGHVWEFRVLGSRQTSKKIPDTDKGAQGDVFPYPKCLYISKIS